MNRLKLLFPYLLLAAFIGLLVVPLPRPGHHRPV